MALSYSYNVLYDYRRSHKVTDDVSSVPADRSVAQADKGLSIDIYSALKLLKENLPASYNEGSKNL